MTSTLYEDRYTFLVISRSFPIRMRNVSDRCCREKQNNILRSVSCLIKSAVYEIMWTKYCTAGQTTGDNVAHALCMLVNLGYRQTLTLFNTYCFTTATMVMRTCFNYVHTSIACLIHSFLLSMSL